MCTSFTWSNKVTETSSYPIWFPLCSSFSIFLRFLIEIPFNLAEALNPSGDDLVLLSVALVALGNVMWGILEYLYRWFLCARVLIEITYEKHYKQIALNIYIFSFIQLSDLCIITVIPFSWFNWIGNIFLKLLLWMSSVIHASWCIEDKCGVLSKSFSKILFFKYSIINYYLFMFFCWLFKNLIKI